MSVQESSTLTPADILRLKLPNASNDAEFLTRLALQRGMSEPLFEEVSERGPPHMKTFVWHCTFNDLVSQGIGPSKKQAKLAAAKAIKDALDYDNLPPVKPVKPVEKIANNELLRKRKELSDTSIIHPNKKREKPMIQHKTTNQVSKNIDSLLQTTRSMMGSNKGGFSGSGVGIPGLNQLNNPKVGIPSLNQNKTHLLPTGNQYGMGFGSKHNQSFNSFQGISSNQAPIGLGSFQSMSPVNRIQQGFGGFQQMPYNLMPFMQMGPFHNPSMLGNVNPMLSANGFGLNMPFMGYAGDFGMNNYTSTLMKNHPVKNNEGRLELEYNPYNPYSFIVGSAKNDSVSNKNKISLMRPSFGGFHSNEAAGPILKGFENIAKERKCLADELQHRQFSYTLPVPNELDKMVLHKHKDLCPSESELKFILKLVSDTEKSLKKVAEDLNKLANQPLKMIEGMLRVGDLSKGLLMVGDRAVNLLLMCKHTPSVSLLRDIQQLITEKLKEVAPNNEYQIHGFEEEAGFCVVAMPPNAKLDAKNDIELQEEDLPFAVNVSLTSMSISETKTDCKDNKKEKKIEDIADPLPKDKCNLALSEMRHSKWFSLTAAKLNACVECIRIVKDISNRDPIWNVVPDWAIEVMVERAALTAWIPLNIGNLLKKVMEMLASGILLSDDVGLKDPCEINATDVMADLTPQQKENLTKSAQRILRSISFNKIHEVLGMDPPNVAEISVHEATNEKKAEKENGLEEMKGSEKEQESEKEKEPEERNPGNEKSPVVKVESLNKENESVIEKESLNKSEESQKHEAYEKVNVQSEEEVNISENEVNIAEKEVIIPEKEVNISEHEVSTLKIDLSAFDNDQALTVNDDNDLITAQEKDVGMVEKVNAFGCDTKDVIFCPTEK